MLIPSRFIVRPFNDFILWKHHIQIWNIIKFNKSEISSSESEQIQAGSDFINGHLLSHFTLIVLVILLRNFYYHFKLPIVMNINRIYRNERHLCHNLIIFYECNSSGSTVFSSLFTTSNWLLSVYFFFPTHRIWTIGRLAVENVLSTLSIALLKRKNSRWKSSTEIERNRKHFPRWWKKGKHISK